MTYVFLFIVAHYADGREVSPTLRNTAEVVSFFDDLFDSVNGTSMYSKSSKGKPLRHAVTEKSPHHEFWKEAINKLENIKFVDDRDREPSVPSLRNWVTTLKSYQRVWQYLKDKNIKVMRPRYLNSDPIENFFGQVRAYNFRNNNPDCQTFKSTFRSLLITRFIKFHSEGYNCEEDSGEQLLKLKALFDTKKRYDQTGSHISTDSPDSSDLRNRLEDDNILSSRQERLNVHSRAYTAGWVIRKIFKKVKCTACEDSLSTKESNYEKDSIHNWISYKEFKSIKQNKLAYPSEYAVRFFGNITLEANTYLEKQPQKNSLIKSLMNIIKSKYSFDFLKCELHKDEVADFFLALTLRLAVFNWCNIINRILKGTDVCRLQNRILPSMQLKAYTKYKTKLKNKKINK